MNSIEEDLHLPEALRSELKKPFGTVMECSRIAQVLKDVPADKPLISIGDSVSTCLIESGISPNLIIWDERVKRHPSTRGSAKLLSTYATPLKVSNPPATITKDAWDAVVKSLGEERASVLVNGEEDLLAIPAVLNAPEGSRVVYGLPPEKGAILIVIDRKIRAVFEDILSRFTR